VGNAAAEVRGDVGGLKQRAGANRKERW